MEKCLDNVEVDVITNDGNEVIWIVESAELRMYELIVANKMETVFPNGIIVCRIYLCVIISNYSGEHLFVISLF